MGKFNEISAHERMSVEEIRDHYFSFLCSLVSIRDIESYSILLKHLHSIQFTWFVPNDDNRESDGISLRERFVDINGLGFYEQNTLNEACSVFEMMIGLAYRIENIMEDDSGSNSAATWFWIMVSNLGMDLYTDYNYDRVWTSIDVDNIISTVVNRTYDAKGHGGLFPLRRTKFDQRKMELWYQMNLYLRENCNVGY